MPLGSMEFSIWYRKVRHNPLSHPFFSAPKPETEDERIKREMREIEEHKKQAKKIFPHLRRLDSGVD